MGRNMKTILTGIIAIVVAFILFPLIFTGADGILAANLTNLTGVSTFVPIIPLLCLVEMLFSGGLLIFSGAKGKGVSVKNVIVPIVVLSVTLLFYPILITAVNTLWTAAGTTYTGFRTFVAIIPMLVLVALMFWGGYNSVQEARGRRSGRKSGGRRRYA
jgi:hypothetical protein